MPGCRVAEGKPSPNYRIYSNAFQGGRVEGEGGPPFNYSRSKVGLRSHFVWGSLSLVRPSCWVQMSTGYHVVSDECTAVPPAWSALYRMPCMQETHVVWCQLLACSIVSVSMWMCCAMLYFAMMCCNAMQSNAMHFVGDHGCCMLCCTVRCYMGWHHHSN